MKKHNDIAGMALELGRMVRKAMAEQGTKDESPILMHGLSFIAEEKDMTMSSFASLMQISRSTATMFIDRLVKGGLAVRAADKANRRVVLLRLTPKGKTAVTRHRKMKEAAFAKIFAVLSPSDKKNLERIFSLVLESPLPSHD